MSTNPTKYQQQYMLAYREDKIKKMKTLLGGKCCVRGCNERRFNKLEFHHVTPICRDRTQPIDNLGIVLQDYHHSRVETFRRKYQLVCADCHDKKNGDGKVQGCVLSYNRRKRRVIH